MADIELLLKSAQEQLLKDFPSEQGGKCGLKLSDINTHISAQDNDLRSSTSKLSDIQVEIGKENGMKRSASMNVSSRGRRRADKKDTCCNGYSSRSHAHSPSPVKSSMVRRCFPEADNSTGSRASEDADSSNISASTEDSRNDSPSSELQEAMEAPPSPMANLRMLFDAVSPEIRKMQESQREEEEKDAAADESQNNTAVVVTPHMDIGPMGPHASRKDKSLGLLCYR